MSERVSECCEVPLGEPPARYCPSCREPAARPCDVCGESFVPRVGSQRFCSRACHEVVYPPRKRTARTCVVCGQTFTTGRANHRLCSIDCRNAYARRRRTERIAERDPYLAVILRDPCAYCGGEASGFDHITPRVDGGGDEWENLAPCCRSCNSSKCATPLLLHLLRGAP